MKEQRKVPQIRFKGFTNDWEQRKLGEVGKARSGVGFPDTEQGGAIGVPFFKVSDMNSDGNENEMTVANNYVTADQIAAHRWLPIEELPAIFFAKVGAAVMLNRKRLCRFPFLLDNNTMAYSLNSTEWDADFAKALFETVDLTSLVQVGALPSYNAGDVEAMEISIPSLSEQGQIGAFFKQLNNLITLHQRKCDKLVEVKNSLLEKMFPKNSSKIPEIRFKGFTDDWEQRKLKDISSYRRGSFPQPYGKEEWYGGSQAMPFVQVADVNDDLKLNEETKQTISKLAQPMSVYIPKESVIVTLQGTIGKVAITQYNTYLDRTILYFDTYKIGNINKYFWALTIKNKFEEERKKAPGAVIKTITKEVLSEFNLNIPQHDEQEKIGMLFANIDNLITLHQRKLEKLKEVKKSMLEKMFV